MLCSLEPALNLIPWGITSKNTQPLPSVVFGLVQEMMQKNEAGNRPMCLMVPFFFLSPLQGLSLTTGYVGELSSQVQVQGHLNCECRVGAVPGCHSCCFPALWELGSHKRTPSNWVLTSHLARQGAAALSPQTADLRFGWNAAAPAHIPL